MAASWAPYEGISKGRVTFIINILGALCCICYSKTYINRVKPHWPGELFCAPFHSNTDSITDLASNLCDKPI